MRVRGLANAAKLNLLMRVRGLANAAKLNLRGLAIEV
jgi:hypothetical protein